MKKFLLFALIILFVLPLITYGFIQEKGRNIYIKNEEVIEKTVFGLGERVEIEGILNKDAFLLGKTIILNGKIKGDFLGAAEDIRINGQIEGNLRAAGRKIEINNRIEKNVTVFGADILFNKNSEISGDIIVFGATIELLGKTKGDVKIKGGNMIAINGLIDGDVDLEAKEIVLLSNASIKGNFNYTSLKEIEIKEGQIEGDIFYTPLKPPKEHIKKEAFLKKIKEKGYSFLSSAIILLVTILVLRKQRTLAISKEMINKIKRNFGWGLIYLIIIPIIALLLLFSIIGIPLALVILIVYILILYLTKIFISLAIGIKLAKFDKIEEKEDVSFSKLILFGIFGLFIFYLFSSLPYFGFLFNIFCFSLVLGTIGNLIREKI